jgi:Kef-type K+ transport system membrane component KefB
LFGVSVIAFGVPFVLGFFPRLRIPPGVVELIAGIVVGPSVLSWLRSDATVQVMATIGVAFLLFLAGMEIDIRAVRGPPLRLGSLAFVCSVAIALAFEFSAKQFNLVVSPLLVAITLSATSVGIILPVLHDTGQLDTPTGRFSAAGGSAAEFGTIVLLAVFFAGPGAPPWVEALLLVAFAAFAAVLFFALGRFTRSVSSSAVLDRLEDSSSQVRVRLAVLLVLGAAVLANRFRFDAILGTFIVGVILSVVLRGWKGETDYRRKLNAVGFGFFVPVFLVSSGLRFDVADLVRAPSDVGRIFALLAVLLIARGVPALLYRRFLSWRETAAAGLLQSTNLSFILVAVAVGRELGAITASGGDGLIAAGLLSALIFPPVAQSLLERERRAKARAESRGKK